MTDASDVLDGRAAVLDAAGLDVDAAGSADVLAPTGGDAAGDPEPDAALAVDTAEALDDSTTPEGAGPDAVIDADAAPGVVPITDPCVAPDLLIPWPALPEDQGVSLFQVIETADLPVDLTCVAASVGDVTGDGRPDIVVGAVAPQLLVNCGDAGLAVLALPLMFQAAPVSTLILDLDGDGDQDLLYGGVSGSVQVVRQTAPFTFEAGQVVVSTPDTLRPTVNSMAVHGDLIHLGQVEFPPRPELDFSADVDAANFDKHKAPNRTLRVVDGELELLPREAHDPAADACWDAPTFASLAISRHHMGRPDLLFEGNDFGPDCLSEIRGPDEPLFPLLDVVGEFAEVNATMGADYFYEGDRVMVVSTEFVTRPHLWSIGDGVDVVSADERLTFVDNFGYRITWGAAFDDFDRDGARDLLIAHAAFVFEDPDLPKAAEAFLKNLAPGGLMLLRGDGEGGFIEAPERLPALDDPAFYGVIVGDFYGGDGYGDGSPDVVVTPMVAVPPADSVEGAVPSALTSTRLLIGRPPAEAAGALFAGVRLPHTLWAAGAVVAMETTAGETLWEPVRSSAGVAGSRDAVARFAVTGSVVPARFRVHLLDGSVHTIEAPKVNEYATIEAP